LNRLARLSALEGNFVEAMLLYKKSLARDERRLGSEHPALAIYLNNVGSISLRCGEFAGAEDCFRRAMKIDINSAGADSLEVARDLHNLATLYHKQNRKDEALEMYKQALAIDRAILGEQAFDVKEIEGELQSHLAGLGAAPKANSLNSAKDWLVTDPEFAAN
jgi:tetratricopeptide (TPR) repeat protein